MKAGLTIEELATEVMRQKDAKADYICLCLFDFLVSALWTSVHSMVRSWIQL